MTWLAAHTTVASNPHLAFMLKSPFVISAVNELMWCHSAKRLVTLVSELLVFLYLVTSVCLLLIDLVSELLVFLYLATSLCLLLIQFECFYSENYSGRKLTWIYNFFHGTKVTLSQHIVTLSQLITLPLDHCQSVTAHYFTVRSLSLCHTSLPLDGHLMSQLNWNLLYLLSGVGPMRALRL